MRGNTVVLFTVLLAATASAQWLETTIPVAAYPAALCYAGGVQRVFIAHGRYSSYPESTVTIIDGATNEVITALRVGVSPYAMCYNSRESKLYCACTDSDSVYVIDGHGDSVLTTISVPMGDYPSLCFNSANNKLYCTNSSEFADSAVTVIDCSADTVVARIETNGRAGSVCYQPSENKVYVSAGDLLVVDGAGDTAVGVLPCPGNGYWGADCVSEQSNRIYAKWGARATDDRVYAIDCAGDSVLSWVEAGYQGFGLCYNSADDKVYYRHYNALYVIDGGCNSVLNVISFPLYPISAPCYVPSTNRLYCSVNETGPVDDSVVVLDGASDSVLCRVYVGSGPGVMCHNPQFNRVYVVHFLDSMVSVIRDSMPPGVVEEATRIQGRRIGPTILQGPELLLLDCRVLDALGRDVTDRRERLSPGVYFLRPSDDCEPSAVQKVIIQR